MAFTAPLDQSPVTVTEDEEFYSYIYIYFSLD